MIIPFRRYFVMMASGVAALLILSAEIGAIEPKAEKTENVLDCAENGIEVSEQKRLAEKLEQFDKRITALCREGNYGQARTKADAFARHMLANPTIQRWIACNRSLSELISGKVATRMEFLQSGQKEGDMEQNVCDDLVQNLPKPRQWTIWP